MCIYIITPDGRRLKTIAELDAAIGQLTPIEDGYAAPSDWPDRDCCLCPIDLEALGKLMNWTITGPEGFMLDEFRASAARVGKP